MFKSVKLFFHLILTSIAFTLFSCSSNNDSNDKNNEFFTQYSETNNDNIIYLKKSKKNKVEFSIRRAIYDFNDGFYDLKGNISMDKSGFIFESSNSNSVQKFILKNSFFFNKDTIEFPNPNSINNKNYSTKIILDTSFYSVSYQDTIYRVSIHNFGYLIHNDRMSIFFGKKVGLIGRYVLLENHILYINGNIFHDMYASQYKQYSYYPRIE